MTTRLTLAALAALAAALSTAMSGCGKQAELARPAPLFGHAFAPSGQAMARRDAAARARADGAAAAGPQALAPQSVDEVRDQRLTARVASDAAPPASSTAAPGPP